MSEFMWGLMLGILGGYALTLLTMLMVWGLCVVSGGDENEERKQRT